MTTKLRGVIHGKTIELPEVTGLPDGQEVAISLELIGRGSARGEGLRGSAGAWAEDGVELDEYLDWNRKQRKVGRQGMDS